MKVKKILGITVISFVTLLVLVLATATVGERLHGSEWVNETVYRSHWFVALWAAVVAAGMAYCCVCALYKRKSVFMLHISFLLILIGAGVTFVLGESGVVHLREGKPNDELPFRVLLDKFAVEYYDENGEPKDFVSYLEVDGVPYSVAMNKVIDYKGYRLYQASFDSDYRGSTLMFNYDPYGVALTYAGYALLLVSMIMFVMQQKGKYRNVSALSVAVTIVTMATLYSFMQRSTTMMPILRSGWFPVHVSLVSIAYLLFFVMAVCGLVGMVWHTKRGELMYSVNKTLIYPALFLLVAGIFVGAVWANVSWGRYWGWDPKEVWALITMLVYSSLLHRRSLKRLSVAATYNKVCLIAFLTVVITYYGVNYLLGGMHSYY